MNWQDKLPLERSQGPLCNKPSCVASISEYTTIIISASVNFKLVCRRTDTGGKMYYKSPSCKLCALAKQVN